MNILKRIFQSPSLYTLGIFAGGNLYAAVLGGLGGLLQARWIEPSVLGEFSKFGIVTSYLFIGVTFVHEGLARQYPYLIGKGHKDEALRVAACAKWWYIFLACAFSFCFLVLAIWRMVNGDFRSGVGWGAQIACVWTATYGLYLSVMYRTSSDFKRLSYNNVISCSFSFIALILVKLLGYWGLATRAVFQNVAGITINRHYVPVKVKATFDSKRLWALARISLPLSIPGYVQSSFLNATVSFIILKYCGQSGLGIYGVALTLQGMAMTFNAAVNQIFIVKLTSKFGETENVVSCLKYARIPTMLSVGVAMGLAVSLSLLIGPLIRLLLPRYEAAIPIIRTLSLVLPLSAAAMPLILLRSALWFRSVAALALTRFLACLMAVAILPKTLQMIAASVVLGELSVLLVGFGILMLNRKKKSN
jgi:O-antigen/teichoic acid export membrane protein